MRLQFLAAVTVIAVSLPVRAAAPELKTDEQKTIYALGALVGEQLRSQYALTPAEAEVLAAGVRDGVKNSRLEVETEEYKDKLPQLQSKRLDSKSQPFLEQMAKEKGARKFPSGLIMRTLKEGTGPNPKATDRVQVHYHGTFPDGKVFDSSVERKTPSDFPLNGVIPCWTEGVQKMKVGEKAKLTCPHDIAYGPRGRGSIPPRQTLVFEVELLDILK